jgi:hypothetical protein
MLVYLYMKKVKFSLLLVVILLGGESSHFWRVQAPKVIFFSSVIDKKEHTSFSL